MVGILKYRLVNIFFKVSNILILLLNSCGLSSENFANETDYVEKDSCLQKSFDFVHDGFNKIISVLDVFDISNKDKANNYYVFFLANGLDGNADVLENYKDELQLLLEKDKKNGVVHVMHGRTGDVPHRSFEEQLVIFQNEIIKKLNKDEISRARMDRKNIVLVFLGHSQGGVIITEFFKKCSFIEKEYNIKQILFVAVTSPLGGIDGDSEKMDELKAKLMSVFNRVLAKSHFSSILTWLIVRAINHNLSNDDLPSRSKSPGIQALSRERRREFINSVDISYPILVVQAECDGLQLLVDTASERSPVPNSYIDEFISQLSKEEKIEINKLWCEVLDGSDSHDGVVPLNSQVFDMRSDHFELKKFKKVEFFVVKASHRSVLEHHGVICKVYDFVIDKS